MVVRGDQVMTGYWRDPDATAAAFTDGWFHTGDLVRRDDEGFVYIVDRKKDLIISGGENVASLTVEQALYRHPAVAEAAAIGVEDDTWGELVCAVVVLRDGARPPRTTSSPLAGNSSADSRCPAGSSSSTPCPGMSPGRSSNAICANASPTPRSSPSHRARRRRFSSPPAARCRKQPRWNVFRPCDFPLTEQP